MEYTRYRRRKKGLSPCGCLLIGLVVLLAVAIGGIALYQLQLAPTVNRFLAGGRTNILLLGSDTDGKGNDPTTGGVPLAQTVLIVTVDPQTNSVGMLSIPRDMQVSEDGYTEPKLDEVFSHGYTGDTVQDKIANGAREMENVIQNNYGIHIDHYAWVGLDGFVKVIDTAGGVDVDVIHPMVDDTYPNDVGNTNGSIYDYKRLYIAPGPQHLDGIHALEYVRTRHSDLIGDFGRTIRQQQIISQLKIKLATPATIAKAPTLIQDLNGAVQTDLQVNNVVSLANLAQNIDSNSVQHLTLGPPDYAEPSTGDRPGNYWPICSNIAPAIQKMFDVAYPTCTSQGATSNTSSFARTTPSTTTNAPTTFNTGSTPEPKQVPLSNGIAENHPPTNITGNALDARVHGLLDILFATTLESFDAMQI